MTLHHRISPENTKSLRTTFSKNSFEELLLVFQLFKQFDLKIRCFILKFQKLFSHGIFKNCFTVLHFSEFETNGFHLLRSFCARKIVVFAVFCSLIFVLLIGFCLICVFVSSKSFRKNK